MRTAIQVEFTYDQILSLVKQLPNNEKIKLTKELEKDGIDSRLSKILNAFKTKELSLATINKEVEIVRKRIHASKKH